MMRIWIYLLLPIVAMASQVSPAQGEVKTLETDAESVLEEAERELAEQGVETDTASVLKALARHDDDLVRAQAARVLGLRAERSAVGGLLAAAREDESWWTRQSAALALHQLGRPEGLESLRWEMSEADLVTRRLQLARQLAVLGDTSGYPLVSEAIDQRTAMSTALLALSAFLPHDQSQKLGAFDKLLGLLSDPEANVRRLALVQLGHGVSDGSLELSRVEGLFEERVSDPDKKVRDTAARLLERWRRIEALASQQPESEPR